MAGPGHESVRVGVIGHRSDLDPERLRPLVDAALDAAAKGADVVVRSALAEGSDRLVADRVLARPRSRLVAVIPLPPNDYAADFADAASRAEFHRLLARAEEVVITSLKSEPPLTREEAYERAGRAVVDGCDVLVAIWDGKPSRGRGGTAEIVSYARSLGRPVAWIRPDVASLTMDGVA